MKTALAPNSIHSYDASVLLQTVEICENLGVKVLIIHDAIGCQQQYQPLVNLVFRLVNVEFLRQNDVKPKFPFISTNSHVTDEVVVGILGSTKFFR